MDAREIESLSMLSRGFEELKDVNPELAYNVIVDILAGINECALVKHFTFAYTNALLPQELCHPTTCANFKTPLPAQTPNKEECDDR